MNQPTIVIRDDMNYDYGPPKKVVQVNWDTQGRIRSILVNFLGEDLSGQMYMYDDSGSGTFKNDHGNLYGILIF